MKNMKTIKKTKNIKKVIGNKYYYFRSYENIVREAKIKAKSQEEAEEKYLTGDTIEQYEIECDVSDWEFVRVEDEKGNELKENGRSKRRNRISNL